jgi:predicted transposase/invertase (TIGR01784 family)
MAKKKETAKSKKVNASKDVHNKHDKTYKIFLKYKKIFLEFIKSFIHEEWVNQINEDDIEIVNKSFILRDYTDKECDLVYRLKLKDTEIYFYVLLELQSTVDFTMPFRLLIYMVELLKLIFSNTDEKIRTAKNYKLPAIVPLVRWIK